MRTWARAPGDTLCGRNPEHQIRTGDPVQLIRVGLGKRTLTRCRLCADGQVPPDLPPLENRSIAVPVTPKSFARFGAAALPFDFKRAAAGREPGEDG